MDIKKLQHAIVDGLEDVKAQAIQVFDTEHLSPLFERVIVASGTSNRQTKALAASVRDAVKAIGFPPPRTEGEDNGEWIIVDCGAAVVHVMQPAIREYYHLEEIWGDKPIDLKAAVRRAKADASEKAARYASPAEPAPKKSSAKKASATNSPAKKTLAKKAAAAKTSARTPSKAPNKAPSKTPVRTAAKAVKAPARTPVVQKAIAVKAPAKKAAPKKAVPAKKIVTRVVGVKSAPKKSSTKTAPRSAPKKGTKRA